MNPAYTVRANTFVQIFEENAFYRYIINSFRNRVHLFILPTSSEPKEAPSILKVIGTNLLFKTAIKLVAALSILLAIVTLDTTNWILGWQVVLIPAFIYLTIRSILEISAFMEFNNRSKELNKKAEFYGLVTWRDMLQDRSYSIDIVQQWQLACDERMRSISNRYGAPMKLNDDSDKRGRNC